MKIKSQDELNQRYEIKFFVENISVHRMESLVSMNPAMFKEIFYMRYVNNIYYDSISLKNYHDNVDGATNRNKYRVRWYGNLFGKIEHPIFEIKTKRGLIGTKQSFPLYPFEVTSENFTESFDESISQSKLPQELIEIIQYLKPTLLNRYSRQYYLSSDNHYRITLDYNQEFIGISKNNNTFQKKCFDSINTILELKYDKKFSANAHAITNEYPFRVTKSSKYVRGIEKIYY